MLTKATKLHVQSHIKKISVYDTISSRHRERNETLSVELVRDLELYSTQGLKKKVTTFRIQVTELYDGVSHYPLIMDSLRKKLVDGKQVVFQILLVTDKLETYRINLK